MTDFARDHFHLDVMNATTIEADDSVIAPESAFAVWSGSPPVWEDFDWICELCPGPIVVNGVTSDQR